MLSYDNVSPNSKHNEMSIFAQNIMLVMAMAMLSVQNCILLQKNIHDVCTMLEESWSA